MIADDLRYDAWGATLAGGTVAENAYRYTGEQFDLSVDGYYLRARYFQPSIGRFSQMDTWAGNTGSPITLNKYLYGNADSVNFTDPTGLYSLGSISAGQTARAELASLQVQSIGIGYATFQALSWEASAPQAQASRDLTAVDVDLAKFQIRRCQRSNGKGCRSNLPLLIYGDDHASVRDHIEYAQNVRGITPILNKRTGNFGDWRKNKLECKGRSRARQCDEYPFNSTLESGPANYAAGRVSLRLLDQPTNSRAGYKLKNFYRECKIKDSPSIGQTFGVVTTRGASTSFDCGRGSP